MNQAIYMILWLNITELITCPYHRTFQVFAFRQDGSSDEIYYRLQSANNGGANMFSVSSSGVIITKSDQTNAESVTEYTLVVEAEDRLTNPPR